MPSSSEILRLRLLHMLEVNLRAAGVSSELRDESVCLFKPSYDKPTATTYGIRSAAATLQRGECFAWLYCVEQYDQGDNLVKFAVHVTDSKKQPLHHWDLDFSHGLHTHVSENGRKSRDHVPFTGGIVDMVQEIVAFVIRRL